jgi:ABC-type dipeptide/oligopeptide/nickel transport system permease component
MRVLFYILRRVLQLIPILVGVSLITFVIARKLPGNAAFLMAGPMATKQQIREVEHKLGLDKPIWEQYLHYLSDVMRGDLGTSWRSGKPVLEELLIRFPATFELITVSMIVALLVAIPLGVLAAARQGTKFDHFVRIFSVGGVSIPVFWSGLVLIYVFFFLLHLAPAPVGRLALSVSSPRTVTGFYILDSILTLNWRALLSTLSQMALPVITLTFAMLSPIVRITRTSMLDVLRQDYIRSALASGVGRRAIIYWDALKNALPPIITMIGLQYGYSLGGEVLVEQIFSWPGMGRYSVDAIFNLDYAAVQGFVLVVAAVYITIYLAVDILYAALDPRIRY